MSILISFGQTKPHDELVKLMLEKISTYHFSRGAELRYGYRWAKEGQEPATYDDQCWHIRDKNELVTIHNSTGFNSCQALLEGLQEGWDLSRKFPEPPPKPVRKPRALKNMEPQPDSYLDGITRSL